MGIHKKILFILLFILFTVGIAGCVSAANENITYNNTTAGTILPKAGSSLMIIVGIVIFIIIAVGLYIKKEQYKGIK